MLDSINNSVETIEAERGVPTYAALFERKFIVPSTSEVYLAVDREFFFKCFGEIIANISIDEVWYLKKYRDVAEAIEQGIVAGPKNHYVRFGYYEHRLPYRIEVDDSWYLAEYPDVKAAVEKRQFASGQAHFDAIGFREGRLPSRNFTLRTDEAG